MLSRQKNFIPHKEEKAQTAFEYLLLLAVVVAVVLVGFSRYLPKAHEGADIYFNKTFNGIAGEPFNG